VRKRENRFWHLLWFRRILCVVCWPIRVSIAKRARTSAEKLTRVTCVRPARPSEKFAAGSQIIILYIGL
jgi:hypothetical protein